MATIPKEILDNMNKKKSKRLKKQKDVMVDTKMAFYKPASEMIAELKSKIDVPDYSNIQFDEDIVDFSLASISPESKKQIIEIIRADKELKSENFQVSMEEKRKHSMQSNDFSGFNLNERELSKSLKGKIENDLDGLTPKEEMEYFEKSLNSKSEPLPIEVEKLINPSIFKIDPSNGMLLKEAEENKDRLISQQDFLKQKDKEQADRHYENRFNLLFKLMAATNPTLNLKQVDNLTKNYIKENE